MNFETPWIHILRDVFATLFVVVLIAEVRYFWNVAFSNIFMDDGRISVNVLIQISSQIT